MYIHPNRCNIHTNERLLHSCFERVKSAGFQGAKTSVNKRFQSKLIRSNLPNRALSEVFLSVCTDDTPSPTDTSTSLCGCKITTIFIDIQIQRDSQPRLVVCNTRTRGTFSVNHRQYAVNALSGTRLQPHTHPQRRGFSKALSGLH